MADLKNRHYQELIAHLSGAAWLPGAVAALAAAREAGLRIGLAAVSRNAFAVLDRLGIGDRFDYVVDAARVANSQPDPGIFLTAARELGVADLVIRDWIASASDCLDNKDNSSDKNTKFITIADTLVGSNVTTFDQPGADKAGAKMVEMLLAVVGGADPATLQVLWQPVLLAGSTVGRTP